MSKPVRIGTRKSKLAIRQAELVRNQLSLIGMDSELEFIISEGDKTQDQPDLIMEGAGIFTKAIDDAIISGKVDLGVHSLKDMLPEIDSRLIIACVLERDDPSDVLIGKNKDFQPQDNVTAIIATGSIRRKAQWLSRYSLHSVVPVRGNIDTRLVRLSERPWDGMILAAAGLNRLNINVARISLEWMIPAPGQGIIAVVTNVQDAKLISALQKFSHEESMIAARIEKEFLGYLEAGCSVPIGALAIITEGTVRFTAQVLSRDGKQQITINLETPVEDSASLAKNAAALAFDHGARNLILEDKS